MEAGDFILKSFTGYSSSHLTNVLIGYTISIDLYPNLHRTINAITSTCPLTVTSSVFTYAQFSLSAKLRNALTKAVYIRTTCTLI